MVKIFKEKPSKAMAEEYIAQGALWNGGIFAYKLKYVMEIAHNLINFTDYNDLFVKYDTLEKISFDYAVVERKKDTSTAFFWEMKGSWNVEYTG